MIVIAATRNFEVSQHVSLRLDRCDKVVKRIFEVCIYESRMLPMSTRNGKGLPILGRKDDGDAAPSDGII